MIPLHYDDSDRQLAFYKSNRDYKQIIKLRGVINLNLLTKENVNIALMGVEDI